MDSQMLLSQTTRHAYRPGIPYKETKTRKLQPLEAPPTWHDSSIKLFKLMKPSERWPAHNLQLQSGNAKQYSWLALGKFNFLIQCVCQFSISIVNINSTRNYRSVEDKAEVLRLLFDAKVWDARWTLNIQIQESSSILMVMRRQASVFRVLTAYF